IRDPLDPGTVEIDADARTGVSRKDRAAAALYAVRIQIPLAGVGQRRVVLFDATLRGGNRARYSRAVLDIERIDPDPGANAVGVPRMGHFYGERVWAGFQSPGCEEHLLVACGTAVGIYGVRGAIQGNRGEA